MLTTEYHVILMMSLELTSQHLNMLWRHSHTQKSSECTHTDTDTHTHRQTSSECTWFSYKAPSASMNSGHVGETSLTVSLVPRLSPRGLGTRLSHSLFSERIGLACHIPRLTGLGNVSPSFLPHMV